MSGSARRRGAIAYDLPGITDPPCRPEIPPGILRDQVVEVLDAPTAVPNPGPWGVAISHHVAAAVDSRGGSHRAVDLAEILHVTVLPAEHIGARRAGDLSDVVDGA